MTENKVPYYWKSLAFLDFKSGLRHRGPRPSPERDGLTARPTQRPGTCAPVPQRPGSPPGAALSRAANPGDSPSRAQSAWYYSFLLSREFSASVGKGWSQEREHFCFAPKLTCSPRYLLAQHNQVSRGLSCAFQLWSSGFPGASEPFGSVQTPSSGGPRSAPSAGIACSSAGWSLIESGIMIHKDLREKEQFTRAWN